MGLLTVEDEKNFANIHVTSDYKDILISVKNETYPEKSKAADGALLYSNKVDSCPFKMADKA